MFFSVFLVFSVRHKNTRQPFSETAERIFMKLLPNDSGENVVSNVTEMGARHPNNSLGAKNYTLRNWWWRLASDWELVCWLWHCAATAVALKRHERANAFNLVNGCGCHYEEVCLASPIFVLTVDDRIQKRNMTTHRLSCTRFGWWTIWRIGLHLNWLQDTWNSLVGSRNIDHQDYVNRSVSPKVR